MKTKTRLILIGKVLIIFVLIIISSCKKENDVPGTTPVLPPSESILMDFSSFSNADDTIPGIMGIQNFSLSATYGNWGKAFITVSTWNIIAAASLAVPTTCYLTALNTDPVYKGDNTWEWPCSYTSNSITYEAVLRGKRISNEEFKAEMYITKTGVSGFTSFKWFEGVVRFDRTHALWTLYENPANPVQLLQMEWNKNWENNTGDIKYTYVKTGSVQTGSYIQFKISTDPIFEASYTVATAGNNVIIEWNRVTKNGHIKDPVRFIDAGQWHCWDEFLRDAICQ